jgi:glycosyltransferase involved in cell wall biosynthesis
MGKEGRKKVEEKFRWEMVAEKIEDVYKDVLKGKKDK